MSAQITNLLYDEHITTECLGDLKHCVEQFKAMGCTKLVK